MVNPCDTELMPPTTALSSRYRSLCFENRLSLEDSRYRRLIHVIVRSIRIHTIKDGMLTRINPSTTVSGNYSSTREVFFATGIAE